MSSRITELRAEAVEALETVWFMQRLEETERTDVTLSLRFHIRPGLFVHVFCGELSGALYFSLIEDGQRVFGIDCEQEEWHMHPYGVPAEHQILEHGLEPKPLHTFLRRVEELLLEFDFYDPSSPQV